MHTQNRLLMSYLLFVLSSSLVCMEPHNNANLYTDALSTESADELYDRVGQKILDTYEYEKAEIYTLSMALLFKDIGIGLRIDRWSDADQSRARGRIVTIFASKRISLEREFLAFKAVHRNFHEALISGDIRPVNGIRSIVNRVKYNAPFPAHPREMFVDDIRTDLWPHIKRASECLLVDYAEPLHNKLALQKEQQHKK